MALPSSGQISFNDVRTETSQSGLYPYNFYSWAGGEYIYFGEYPPYQNFAPINLLSSGSRFSISSPMTTPLSMSQWYSYDHSAYIGLDTTASLYQHSSYNCYPSSMIVIDVGTSNASLTINISGSGIDIYNGYGCWYLVYGKPWAVNGGQQSSPYIRPNGCAAYIPPDAILIDSGSSDEAVNKSIIYNYTYNSASGSRLYFVVYGDPCYAP